MLRVLYRHRSGTIIDDLKRDQIPEALRDSGARIWIDLHGSDAEEQRQVLERVFRFHPLAVEDAIQESHVPKIDDYGSYLFLVFHTFKLGDERMDIDTWELDMFLGSNYLITIHQQPSVTIEKLWDADYHREQGLTRGVAMLLYELLDRQLDGYIALMDEFELHVEELGDVIFTGKSIDEHATLNDILTAKSSALRVRRVLIPQREVLMRLAQTDFGAIPADARLYFSDLYDHILRLSELAESMRDLVNSTMTTHLTLSSNRLNEVMKVLTIISTIFIPLSFIAGVYGMNFEYMPELGWRWAYPLVWLVFIGVSGGMLLFFRRRGWL